MAAQVPGTPLNTNRGLSVVLSEATTRALSGGLLGATAMTVQVASLMWVSQLASTSSSSFATMLTALLAILHLLLDLKLAGRHAHNPTCRLMTITSL